MKKMHKLIVTVDHVSAVVGIARRGRGRVDSGQQAAVALHRATGSKAKIIRDSMLQVAGLLNAKMGGPGVFPPLPPGMPRRAAAGRLIEAGGDAIAAASTSFVRRNTRYPMFEAFDMPDTHESCCAARATRRRSRRR